MVLTTHYGGYEQTLSVNYLQVLLIFGSIVHIVNASAYKILCFLGQFAEIISTRKKCHYKELTVIIDPPFYTVSVNCYQRGHP